MKPNYFVLIATHPTSEVQAANAKEINKHCRQAIVDNHRWIMSWSGDADGDGVDCAELINRTKIWCHPHVYGDVLDLVPDRPKDGSFRERAQQIFTKPIVKKQHCYTHGDSCNAMRCSDIDMSGLPCEENSRQNFRRKYMEGRFGDLYITWAHRHRMLQTPLIILENTEESWVYPANATSRLVCFNFLSVSYYSSILF